MKTRSVEHSAKYGLGLLTLLLSLPVQAANPIYIGGYLAPGYASDVVVSGNYAYVVKDGLLVIDVSNPTNCILADSYSTGALIPPTSVGVAVHGRYAYLVVYGNAFGVDEAGLEVIDVSNPTNCFRVGRYGILGRPFGVAVSGNYIYMAISSAGLQVINVSDPNNCVGVGGYSASSFAVDVAVSGKYAYVADRYAGLEVIDVSDPTNCVRVGGCATSGSPVGVAASGQYAYVAEGDAGLEVIDVSNPTNCARVGGYDTSGYAVGVAVKGNYACVADGLGGLQLIDVSDPTNCVRVGGFVTGRSALSVAVNGNFAYLAEGFYYALTILQIGPVLNVVRSDPENTVVSWPVGSGAFTLQQATNLVSPFWQDVADALANDGTNFHVTLPATNQSRAFRLKSP